MNNENQYFWLADGSHIPDIPLHTKAKHRVLEEYVQAWIETLAGHGKFGVKTVTLIDGFCGGGIYRDDDELWEGSSLRMIRRIQEGFSTVQSRKPWQELDFEFIFIDNDREHTACLELQLRNAGFEELLRTEKCKIITENFEDALDFCISRIRERKGYSFFFLDPFGLNISPAIVRRILGIGRSEILFNYMLSGLVRLFKHRDNKFKNIFEYLEAGNYYHEIPKSEEDFQARQALLRDETLRLFRQEGKAQFAHTFSLISKRKAPLYYLVHLSSNPTALTVMKDVSWEQNNLHYQFDYGACGVGYKTIEELEENLYVFDINADNINYCLNDLIERIANFVMQSNQEINPSFSTAYCSTFQENPATKDLYIQAVNQLQEDGEIIILRNGKETKSRLIRPKDILRKNKAKQLFAFNMSDITSVTRRRSNAKKKLNIIVTPDSEQLNLL
jgi:three-Cys-motif partner protein